MSVDLVLFANDASSLVQVGILMVGLYRAVEMRRGFIDPTYRSRALWSALLMVTIAVTNALTFVSLPATALGSLASLAPFLAIVIVCYAFIDRTVLVAMGSDFFHRDVLGWTRTRIPSYLIFAASSLAVLFIATFPPYGNSSAPPAFGIWGVILTYQFFAVAIALLGYGAVAAVYGSRRTSDLTLKRHIRLLAVAVGFFVIAILTFSFSSGDLGQIISDALTMLATYFLYRSVMSLTSLGRIDEKEAGNGSQT